MAFVILLFLVIFWIGAILLVLSVTGVIAVSAWAVLVVWLIALGLYSTLIAVFAKRIDVFLSEREILDSSVRAGAEKVKKMREEEARHALMYDDYGV